MALFASVAAVPHGGGLPTGTVTFLFTDVEGSTRLWEEHPESMKVALARHDEILLGVVTTHDGHVVKTTGDGLHAAFARAGDAIRAAIAAQLALMAADRIELRLRMGVHTGATEERGGDYFGPAVNRAARLAAAAHGGQIVASLATEELVRDELSGETELVDLGEHRLRDLVRPERVFQVSHPDLRQDFPGLRGTDMPRGNLPAEMTSFVGRDNDVMAISSLVLDGPLVTLIGVGGVGKTRLATRVASSLERNFADGAWFCDLSGVTEDDSVMLALATALAMEFRAGATTERVIEYLTGRHLLLVLDNCEHVLDAAGSLVDLMVRACPDVHVLATSREALALDAERLWPLRPLPLPAPSGDADMVAGSPPVQLFVDRARAVRPDFDLSEHADPVVDICRALDGIPLAIELAAARVRSLSPADIAQRLDQRFALLSGARRGAVSRHETLRAAVDWSYDLLDAAERTVLQRMAVFVSGFSFDAAEVVTVGATTAPVLDVLTRLVDKSLLSRDEDVVATRYRMLETIRQYAIERLDEGGNTTAARDAHLAYFVDFAGRAGPGLMSADERRWEAVLHPELDNLRSAVVWAAERGDADRALRIATSFPTPSLDWGGRRWDLDSLADVARSIPAAEQHPMFPLALVSAAGEAQVDARFDEAVRLAEQALATPGATRTAAQWRAEGILGIIAMRTGGDAAAHFERALEIAEALDDPVAIAGCRSYLAVALPLRDRAHLSEAIEAARVALAMAEQTRCPPLISKANFALGFTLAMAGDDGAREPLLASLENTTFAGARTMLAMYDARQGRTLVALEELVEAFHDALETSDHSTLLAAIEAAASVLWLAGEPTTAAELGGALSGGRLPRLMHSGVAGERDQRMAERVAAALGPVELEAARARGAAMTEDEVVEHALSCIHDARGKLLRGKD